MYLKKYLNTTKNHYVEIIGDIEVNFYSYNTLICTIQYDRNTLILNGNWWAYSQTTTKHFRDVIKTYCPFVEYKNKKDFSKTIERLGMPFSYNSICIQF